MADISVKNYTGTRATDRGTPIAKAGKDMDKNAFLKILSAELSNMDPMADNDSTAYVTQMAQFASMEQMTNLNTTMSNSAAYDLVGKGVAMNQVDSAGNQYTGIVKGVSTSGGRTIMSVAININGKNEFRDFDVTDVVAVLDAQDNSLPAINSNTSFLVATAFIGKDVELNEKDKELNNLKGTVLGVIKDAGVIKVRVKLYGTDEIKEFTYDKVIKVTAKGEEMPEITNPVIPDPVIPEPEKPNLETPEKAII